MKGVLKYLRKHGYHFTRELVSDVIHLKWSPDNIMESAQRKVYYNVTGATDGDMVYIVHWLYNKNSWPEMKDKNRCINKMLQLIGSGDMNTSYFFSIWLYYLKEDNKRFDFTPYI